MNYTFCILIYNSSISSVLSEGEICLYVYMYVYESSKFWYRSQMLSFYFLFFVLFFFNFFFFYIHRMNICMNINNKNVIIDKLLKSRLEWFVSGFVVALVVNGSGIFVVLIILIGVFVTLNVAEAVETKLVVLTVVDVEALVVVIFVVVGLGVVVVLVVVGVVGSTPMMSSAVWEWL